MSSPLIKFGLSILVSLANNRQKIGEILEKSGRMLNIKTSTLGGKVFWTDLVEHEGWRLQKNDVFGNCRIIDPNDIRIAWGGKSDMIKSMESLLEKEITLNNKRNMGSTLSKGLFLPFKLIFTSIWILFLTFAYVILSILTGKK